MPGRIHIRVQHRTTGATHRPICYAIADAIAGITDATMVDGILRGIDDIANGTIGGRMPAPVPSTVVNAIVHGIAGRMREWELGHVRYQIENRRLGRKKGPVRVYTDQYRYGFLNISRPHAVHGRSGLKSTPKLAGVDSGQETTR